MIRLPLAPVESVEVQSPRRHQPTGSPPLRFLVADDNVDAAESLGMVLELLGNEVSLVHDG